MLLSIPHAYADGKIVSAGQPEKSDLSPVSNEPVVDVWSRQLAYHEASMEYRRILLQRQESYAAPLREAKAQYAAALAALNATREDERGETR